MGCGIGRVGLRPPLRPPPTPAEGYAIWTIVHSHSVSRWIRDGSPYFMALRRSRGGAQGGAKPHPPWGHYR